MDGSTFFRDGIRQIDFVLAYRENDTEEAEKNVGILEDSETDGEGADISARETQPGPRGNVQLKTAFMLGDSEGFDKSGVQLPSERVSQRSTRRRRGRAGAGRDLDSTQSAEQQAYSPPQRSQSAPAETRASNDELRTPAKASPEKTSTRQSERRTRSAEPYTDNKGIKRWLSLRSLQHGESSRKNRINRFRSRFVSELQKLGLQVERIPADDQNPLHFVLIHAPLPLLEEYGEKLGVNVPVRNTLLPHREVAKSRNNCFRRVTSYLFERRSDKQILQDQKRRHFEPYKRGQPEKFLNGNEPEKIFSTSDRARIVYELLRSTQYGNKEKEKVGIERLLRAGAFAAAYPLHQSLRTGDELWSAPEEELNRRELLVKHWGSLRALRMRQPIDLVKDYFGAKVALYFAFLGTYTRMMALPSLLGFVWLFCVFVMLITDQSAIDEVCNDHTTILCPKCDNFCDFRKMDGNCFMAKVSYLFDQWGVLIVGVCITVWAQVFLQAWKRNQNALTYRWGLKDAFYQEATIRLDFKLRVTTLRTDPVTDRVEPYLTWNKRAVNLLVNVLLFLGVAMFIIGSLVLSFFLRRFIDQWAIMLTKRGDASDTFNTLFSSSVIATLHLIIILTFNAVYQMLIEGLVEWECPRTQLDFDNSFILKIFVAEFFNTNSSLFFIAFAQPMFGKHWSFLSSQRGLGVRACISNCFVELTIQMGIIFIGTQLAKAIFESIIPVLIKRGKLCRARFANWTGGRRGFRGKEGRYEQLKDTSVVPQWESDYYLCANEPHFLCYEYAELVMQFSVLVLFSPAFPLAALFALINNLIEIRADSYKFLRLKQRPVPEEVESIGIWTNILEFIVRLSVYVNALLIAFTSEFVPSMKWRVHNGSFKGYANHSHSIFDTRFLPAFSPSIMNSSEYFNTSIVDRYGAAKTIPLECRYYGFYTPHCIVPPNSTEYGFDPLDGPQAECVRGPKIEFSDEWWYNTVLRLCVAIAFVLLLNALRWIVRQLYSEMPQKVAKSMARDKFYGKKRLLESGVLATHSHTLDKTEISDVVVVEKKGS
ncbi:unnamed protein product, partial [Mesorhabditis spiculigera]